MALLALLTRDVEIERAARGALGERHAVVRSGGWGRFLHTLRERPVTCAILDESWVPPRGGAAGAVAEVRARFPSVPLVWLARPGADPFDLLRLGRVGVDRLLLVAVDDVAAEIGPSVARALGRGTEALVTREVSPYLPPRPLAAVRMALDSVHRRPNADDFALRLGLSRPHLSVLLKECGLPSVGHLLVWGRLLHAGRWLSDPGRSGESVSRQLEYSSGAAFRRALRGYVGLTPTDVVERGGLQVVLERFLQRSRMGRWGRDDRTAA